MRAVPTLRLLLIFAFLPIAPCLALAGPAEDADAALARWSASYSANDPDAITANYWPDAILLGTVSPVMSIGSNAIRTYFSAVKDTGNTSTIGEHHTIVLDDNAVVVTGFYIFNRMNNGNVTPAPSRFTMLWTRRDGTWRIAHHHSSPLVQPK